MSRSAIHDVVHGRRTDRGDLRRPTGGAPARGGILDLALVVALLATVVSRTPLGAMGWYALERARGHAADLPTLTAYFESGAVVPPSVEELSLLPPLHDDTTPLAEGALPEPWRTAARAALAELPDGAAARVAAAAELPEQDRTLAWLDRAWAESGDVEAALEDLAIGAPLRERAVSRARAAGEAEPHRYVAHRRYLPGDAQRDADRVVQGTLALSTVLDLKWPLEVAHRISSPWGDRKSPFDGSKSFHNGVDLAVPVGTPVLVAQAGEIAVVGEDDRSGRFLVVDHGNGVRTAYCHLSEILFARGDRVTRGQEVAKSGNTGRSTGPHLHYVVRIAGKTVDPQLFRRAVVDPVDTPEGEG